MTREDIIAFKIQQENFDKLVKMYYEDNLKNYGEQYANWWFSNGLNTHIVIYYEYLSDDKWCGDEHDVELEDLIEYANAVME